MIQMMQLIGTNGGRNSGPYVLYLMAAVSIAWVVLAIFNPRNMMKGLFSFGRRRYRIGSVRQGVWYLAKTDKQFRVIVGLFGLIMAGLCLYFAVLLT
jgi:hypothetical protein